MPWIVALGAVDGSAVVALTARGADAAQTQSLGAAVVALLTEVVDIHALDRGLVIRRARHGCCGCDDRSNDNPDHFVDLDQSK